MPKSKIYGETDTQAYKKMVHKNKITREKGFVLMVMCWMKRPCQDDENYNEKEIHGKRAQFLKHEQNLSQQYK